MWITLFDGVGKVKGQTMAVSGLYVHCENLKALMALNVVFQSLPFFPPFWPIFSQGHKRFNYLSFPGPLGE